MNHSHKTRKFGRETDQRRALMRSLAQALIVRSRITTTEAKAKSLRPFVERLITRAKSGTVAARRDVVATLGGDTRSTAKLFKTVAPKFADRAGGYTRIVKAGPRKGDASPMAIIELVA
jgi:large subunit ribosomal protein L17